MNSQDINPRQIAKHMIFDRETSDYIWLIFKGITQYWGEVNPEAKDRYLVSAFIESRISFDAAYGKYYGIAAQYCKERNFHRPRDIESLLTHKEASINAAESEISIVKKFVVNELIDLYLASGGFKAFSDAKNHPGYFGGTLIRKQNPPYRKLQSE